MFFVISGYIITRLLLNEFEQSGRIDLKSFWIRRARRLLPPYWRPYGYHCAVHVL